MRYYRLKLRERDCLMIKKNCNTGGILMMPMTEKKYDELLCVKTTNVWDRPVQSAHYFHYEATSYSLLNALFHEYELEKTDGFVDFGCGKGRVLFYVHNRFHIPVTGIEMNEDLYGRVLENRKNYLRKIEEKKASILLECSLAEEYEVKETENRFYLFNPFTIEIFKKVIGNILHSVEQHNREVDIILYYPTAEYIQYLETQTPFKLLQEVKVPGLYNINKNERFLIFRLHQ